MVQERRQSCSIEASVDDAQAEESRLPYYTTQDVSLHNCAEDCWITVQGKVFDITELIANNRGPLADPLIACAGTDISGWFNAKTGEPKTCVHKETCCTIAYTPQGRYIHLPPPHPTTKWDTSFGQPWWADQKYVVGKLSTQTRRIRIVNILAEQEEELLVAAEDSIRDIQSRYNSCNAHAASYTWKCLKDDSFVVMDMDATLEENGVVDESLEFEKLQIEDDFFIPVLHIYFNDDLTVA